MKEQINWLYNLSLGLKTLKSEEFNYNNFITTYNHNADCGTVCCAYGWMPKFVPESGIEWVIYPYGNVGLSHGMNKIFGAIDYGLIEYMFRGANHTLAEIRNSMGHKSDYFMFMLEYDGNDMELYGNGLSSNLSQVTNRICAVIDFLSKKYQVTLHKSLWMETLLN